MTENQNLPVNLDDIADFGPGPVIEVTPYFALDVGKGEDSQPGKWRFESLAFKAVKMVLVTGTEFRRVFTVPYEVDKDAPIACASWDGKHAFGMGDQTPIRHEDLMERSCEGCEAARTFTCKPSFAFLIAFKGTPVSSNSETGWQLAIYRSSGLQVKSARAIWGKVGMFAETFRLEGRKLPRWCFGLDATSRQRTSRRNFTGWEPVFGDPSVLSGEDLAALAPLMSKEGAAVALWNKFLDQSKADAMNIGQEPEGEEGAAAAPADLGDDVPF